MKLRTLVFTLGISLLARGGEGLYHAARSRQQVTMTCDQFVRERPANHWVRLTGCDLDYAAPGYREANGEIAEIFFPVRVTGHAPATPVPVLAATADPGALAMVQGTIGNGRQADQEAITVMMLRVVTALRVSREVEGLARSGIMERFQTRRSLQSFPVPLDPNYVVIDLHARPQFVIPAIETGVALIAVLWAMLTGPRRKPGPVAEAEGALTAPEALPAMLLLNLDTTAGAGAIEHAPPLGSREDTIAGLRRALGNVTFDNSGVARVSRPDYTLSIDLGAQDPVWTATLRASGDGAASAVTALSGTMGWRVYVPKRGAFM